jgi:hypothetical protein
MKWLYEKRLIEYEKIALQIKELQVKRNMLVKYLYRAKNNIKLQENKKK